jgi:TolB-like protein/DNA-binding winged helix-turn-helix (wHTH) protein
MIDNEFNSNADSFRVGSWQVRPGVCEIVQGRTTVKLQPKMMDLLQLLASRPGEVFTRRQIEEQVWPDVIVGYDALTKSVGKLREALGDTGKPTGYIQTIPKKGYRLIAQVGPDNDHEPAIAVAGKTPDPVKTIPQRKRTLFAGLAIVAIVMSLAVLMPGWQTNVVDRLAFQEIRPGAQSLVVLPFRDLNADPQQAYFTQGITDDLITDLSGYAGMEVITSRIAFQYSNLDLDPRALANKLEVRYVVEGSIRRTEDEIRINVQMIDAQRGSNLWAKQYNRPLSSLFDIQDEVRAKIVSALSQKLTQAEPGKEQKRYTNSYEAYDLFLQGQSDLIKRASAVDNRLAAEQFERAVAIDPGFARAYAALAIANADAYRHIWVEDPELTGRIALQQARHAIELDPELRYATLAAGYVEFFVAGNHQQAAAMAERTLQLDPKNADAHLLLATIYVHANEYKKSEAYVESSMRLHPTPPSMYFHIGAVGHLLQSDYPSALKMLEKSMMVNPDRLLGKIYMTITLVRMNRLDDAEWYAEEILSAAPDFDAEQWANKQPFKNSNINRQLRDDLRKAGLK